MRRRVSFGLRLADGVTMFIVTALSLLLLVYVGFGEGKRTYEQFHVEKLTAQGRIVQISMEKYLRAGLPLKQYVGFKTLSEPIVESEDVDALAVYDQSGTQVFLTVDRSNPPLPQPSPAIRRVKATIELDSTGDYFQVILPLRTRFETVGSVVVTSSKKLVDKRLEASFRPLLPLVVVLSAAFGFLVSVGARRLVRLRAPWLQVGYGLTFLTMAVVVIVTLVTLYSDGFQDKARAAATTLSQRLHDYVEFNLRLRDFDGLETVFGDFQHVNADVSEAALIVDDVTVLDTQPSKLGKVWFPDQRTYEYIVTMSRPEQPRQVKLAVTVPVDLVYQQVERSVKNFAALFVASAFLAGLFLQVASSMHRLALALPNMAPSEFVREESALTMVKPIFFLAVFLENMTYSFLPQFMQDVATSSGASIGLASLPFTTYYLCFAFSLIPAGYLSDRCGPKTLISSGLLISAVSMLSLTQPIGIFEVTAARGIAGIGQGILFIGVQSYILAAAAPAKKTQGAAIIVFGFQGGMISGMAMGSLLVTYLHPDGVFAISAAIGFITALYCVVLVPRSQVRIGDKAGVHNALGSVGRNLAMVMRNLEFLKTMLLIGVPAKAILTGIITFALPLLFARQGFKQEEIGQVIMLYGIGVVAASGYVSRLVDRSGKTEFILFCGAGISGLGLMMIGLMGTELLGSTALAITGVIVVGIAHGFINAPVITNVVQSELAAQIGENSVAATYRFLERIGHVMGPFLVGQLFLHWGQSPHIVSWIGIASTTFGILFIFGVLTRINAVGPEVGS